MACLVIKAGQEPLQRRLLIQYLGEIARVRVQKVSVALVHVTREAALLGFVAKIRHAEVTIVDPDSSELIGDRSPVLCISEVLEIVARSDASARMSHDRHAVLNTPNVKVAQHLIERLTQIPSPQGSWKPVLIPKVH